MKGPIKSALSVALAMAASQAFALGLGPIQIKSGLNQPLLAEIPVVADSAAEVEDLRVDLASAEDFQRVGLSRTRVTVPIEFTVSSNGRGQKVIRLTTKEAVREPFLDFLIEASWSKGKLLREYTVLLDPPVTAPAVLATTPKPAEKPKPVEAAPRTPVSQPRAEAPKPVAQAAPAPAPAPAPRPAPVAPPPAPKPSAPAAGTYTVQRGDTLSQIASEYGDDAKDYNRMLLALYKANPEAFAGNMNALKTGAVLRIPSSDEVRAAGSLREAAAAVRAQYQSWQGSGTATLVANTGAAPAGEKSAPAPAAPKNGSERLALVPPTTGVGSETGTSHGGSGGGSKDAVALRADLARTKEALSSREQETGELKSRVNQLEDINNKSQRLISLKDSEIAELQNKLKQLEASKTGAKPTETAAIAPAAKPETTAAAPAAAPAAPTPAAAASTQAPAPAPVASTPTPAPVPATPPAAAPATAQQPSAPAAAPPTATPSPAPAAPPATAVAKPPAPAAAAAKPTAAAKPWYADYVDNPYLLYGAGGILVLIAGGLLARVLGKKKVNPRPTRAAAAAVAADEIGEDQHAEMEKEAERYYDHAQAAHSAADTGEPAEGDDDMEQLRRHFDDGDTDRFVALAHSLHEKLPEDSAEWHEVAQLGRQLLPGSPLFAEPALAPTGGHHPDDFFFDEEAGLKHDPVAHEEPNAHDQHLKSMLDEPLEFEPRIEHTQESNELADLEFEREFGKHVGIEPETPVKDHVEAIHDEEPDEAPVSLLDEDTVGTRLDLARAYLDMGDPEGARSMLDEVLAEGNATQQEEARKLLSEIR